MATSKPATKKPTVKSATVKKAPVKRATTVRAKKAPKLSEWDLPSGGKFKTFRIGKVQNFFVVRVTDQTVYWAILCFIVLALGVWVVTIDDKVQRMYDQIDAQNADTSFYIAPVNNAS